MISVHLLYSMDKKKQLNEEHNVAFKQESLDKHVPILSCMTLGKIFQSIQFSHSVMYDSL